MHVFSWLIFAKQLFFWVYYHAKFINNAAKYMLFFVGKQVVLNGLEQTKLHSMFHSFVPRGKSITMSLVLTRLRTRMGWRMNTRRRNAGKRWIFDAKPTFISRILFFWDRWKDYTVDFCTWKFLLRTVRSAV